MSAEWQRSQKVSQIEQRLGEIFFTELASGIGNTFNILLGGVRVCMFQLLAGVCFFSS